jgi:hypothetical protein
VYSFVSQAGKILWKEVCYEIQLTPQQQRDLDAQNDRPPHVIDPRTNTTYILVSEMDYATVQELLEDERRQQAIHAVALRNAAGRMNEAP